MPGLTIPARGRDLLQVNVVCGNGYVTNVGIIQHLDFYLLGKRWEHLNEADLLVPLRLGGVALHRCLPLGKRRCKSSTTPTRPAARVSKASAPPWGRVLPLFCLQMVLGRIWRWPGACPFPQVPAIALCRSSRGQFQGTGHTLNSQEKHWPQAGSTIRSRDATESLGRATGPTRLPRNIWLAQSLLVLIGIIGPQTSAMGARKWPLAK